MQRSLVPGTLVAILRDRAWFDRFIVVDKKNSLARWNDDESLEVDAEFATGIIVAIVANVEDGITFNDRYLWIVYVVSPRGVGWTYADDFRPIEVAPK